MTRIFLHLTFFLFTLSASFLNPRPTQAVGNLKNSPRDFRDSYESALYREADRLRDVYVANVLDLLVVQQPTDKPYYVSNHDGEATQFSMVSQYGNIGLLAHNTLSGRYFSKLAVGQEVHLVYGDGRVESFMVEQVLRFQALQPESVSSAFRNLDRDEVISSGEMFNRAYVGKHRLVFQTCIEAEGNVSWGRLFVVAIPKE
jgi:hypothetical protein